MSLRKFAVFLTSLFITLSAQGAVPNEHFRDALWVAESHGVLKLLAADGALEVEIDSAEEVRAVAVDAVAGRVWVAKPTQLSAYAFDGESSFDVSLEPVQPSADRHLLSVDRRDGSVWLARGTELRLFGFDGAELPPLRTAKDVQAMSLAGQAGQRWIATKEEAALWDEEGSLVATLSAPRGEKLHDLTYDPSHEALWLLTNKQLYFYDVDAEKVDWSASLRNRQRIRLLDGEGAWVAGDQSLVQISPAGERVGLFEYSQPGKLVEFVVDSIDGTLWLATQQHLRHYRPDGTEIDRRAFTGGSDTGRLWSLEMYIDDIPPSVHFTLPESGTLTNDNQLPFVLEYSDIGVGADPATIAFTVNEVAASMDCAEQGEDRSQCIPNQHLPEGENQVAATVEDFNSNASESARVNMTVDTIPPTITVTSPANDSEVTESTVTVTGRLDEMAALTINGEDVPLDGELGFSTDVELVDGANTVHLSAADPAGNTAQAQLTVILQLQGVPPDPVKVAAPIDPSKPTTIHDAARFLFEGEDPIQTDVQTDVIEAKRIAVLRGQVSDRDGNPLSGVTIRAHGHPEYGTTMTRTDGMFDFAVNGGGVVTLEYEKTGYMTVQRSIDTPWQDYTWLPNVVLTAYDGRVTRIDLTSNQGMQVARGSMVSDEDGTRIATLMFPGGMSAEMTVPNGSRQQLDALDVRATEYTVGEVGKQAMPGELPPSSAYTYAMELSVDQAVSAGANSVQFSEPVISYVDNFLEFPTGISIPVGYYNRETTRWEASPDGRIVEVLDIVGGRAVLDVDGSGTPASDSQLAELSITQPELEELAALYNSGSSLWRVSLPHFSPVDYNWPYRLPDDAEPPTQEIEWPDQQEDEPCLQKGSIIECQNQVLGERVEVAGTPFTLNYRSNRVPGRRGAYSVDIPVTGSKIPDSVKRVVVKIYLAGRQFTKEFSASQNQSWTFEWDGLDAYGREPLGAQTASVHIRYVYDGIYVESRQEYEESFARPSRRGRLIGDRTRNEIIMEQLISVPIGVWDARIAGLGGWTANVHHSYEASWQRLFLGTGRTRRVPNMNWVASRYAGHIDGDWGFSGDGGPARKAHFWRIADIAIAPNGDMYVADSSNNRVRRISAGTKTITTVAGNGEECDYYDELCVLREGASRDATITDPRGVAIGPSGNLYIAYRDGVAKVVNDSYLTVLVRDGSARTGDIDDIAVDQSGNVFYNLDNAIKQISSDGEASIIAGTPHRKGFYPKYSLDPTELDVAEDGTLYVVDSGNNLIRRILPDGRREDVAGTPGGRFANAPDGMEATEAILGRPTAMALDPSGRVFFGSAVANGVRYITQDGVLGTALGGSPDWIYCPSLIRPERSECEEGTFARNLFIDHIKSLAIDAQGTLFAVDTFRSVIWELKRPFPSFSINENPIPSRDGSKLYVFDLDGKHLRTVDVETGNVIYRFEYGDHGFLTSVVDAHGNETTIRRDEAGEPLAIIGPFGQETSLTVDESGYLVRIEDPLGHSHEYAHDDGLLRSARDPSGNVSRFDYDVDGRLVADTDAVGGGWTLSRNDFGDGYEVTTRSAENWSIQHRVEREDDGTWSQVSTAPHGGSAINLESPDGTATSTAPDEVIVDSRMAPHPILGPAAPFVAEATMSLPGGQSMAVERNLAFSGDRETPFGEHDVDETVTVNDREYHSHYEAASRTWTRTSPEGRTSTVQLNEQGRVVSSRLGSLAPVERTFNSRGQVGQVNQSTRTTSLTYDGNGYLNQIVDAESSATTLENDRVGRTRELRLPGERLVSFDFDANGNVTGITPPERPTHGFAYNGVDLATRYKPPPVDGTDSTVETDYRLDRTMGAVSRADGGNVDLAYEESTGLLTGIAAPQGSHSYTYLPNSDRLASATGPAAQRLDYAWNGPLVDQVTWSGEIDGQVDYAWDDNFWLDALTVNGQTIDYQYDNDGLVTGAGSLSLDYAPDVPLLESTSLGSVQTGWTYNEYGEPSSYQAGLEGGSTLFRAEFTRDRLGRITEKMETVGGMETTYAYEYDVAGRLIEVRESGTVVDTYSYDANGNRLSHDGTTGVYDAQDRLLSYGDYDFAYTPDGELESKTNTATGETTRYSYDAFSNLRTVTLPEGTDIEYVIDAQNRRIGKKVNGTLVQGFLYADQLNPVAELDGDGSIESLFVYASRLNVPDYIIKSGRIYRIIADHLGSVRLVADTETGNIVQRMEYSAFGRVIQDTNPGFQPFGFASGVYDGDTGLVRFGVRDYDSRTGRWSAKDPILFDGRSPNLFLYAFGDPINYADPDGQASLLLGGPQKGLSLRQQSAIGQMSSTAALGGVTGGLANAAAPPALRGLGTTIKAVCRAAASKKGRELIFCTLGLSACARNDLPTERLQHEAFKDIVKQYSRTRGGHTGPPTNLPIK